MSTVTPETDLSDLVFWGMPRSHRSEHFAQLRARPGHAFNPEPEFDFMPPGPGYWSLVRHAEVVEASRRADDFCSGHGTNIPDLPPVLLDFFGSMINMDDPRHARLRRIVSRAFTPKMLESLKADVEGIAAEIVSGIAERGECDFVTEVAAKLPLRIIVDLMGIPRSEEQYIFERSNVILGFTDPEYGDTEDQFAVMGALLQAGQDLASLVSALAEERQKNPRNDLTTELVTAEVDGEHLSPEELASFFILLVVAGNETTRNAIAHGLHLITEHPDQRAIWQDDFDAVTPTAVEEIVRLASPVIHFRRTVTRDGVRLGDHDFDAVTPTAIEEIVRLASPVIHFRRTVTRDGVRLGDHEFSEGEKVVLWYWSANRDESVFDRPEEFDVRRTPNDHVGFGGPGPHFCLGAHLARREMTVAFRELFTKLPDIHATEPPDYLLSGFINGVKHLPAAWTPTAA